MAKSSVEALRSVGPRLRLLRQEREKTLTDLSTETGISVSTISRLESGERRPTLEHLLRIAHSYGVSLDELIDTPVVSDPRVQLRPIERHGVIMLPLTRRARGIQAHKLVFPGRSKNPEPRAHEGYEWLYVLNGCLRLVLGDAEFVLSPGEAAEFDTRIPHSFGSSDGDPVEVLSLFGKEGERVHLRAGPKQQKSLRKGRE